MNITKTFVAAAIAVSAIVTTVPVVHAQGTTATTAARSTRAANRQLSKQVMASLYKHKDMDWTDVHAIARSGKVTLVGVAKNQEQIDLAGKVAGSVPGVTSVKNNLTVEEEGAS